MNTQKNLDLSAIYQLEPAAMDRVDLPAPIRKIANRFKGGRELERVLAETQISDGRALAVVRKLTVMGILAPLCSATTQVTDATSLTTKSRRAPRTDRVFTALESSFFDATLPPLEEHDEHARTLGERMELSFAELFARLQGREVIP